MINVASGQNTACSEALTEDSCSYQLSSYQLSADSLYWWSMLPVLRMLVHQQASDSAEDSSSYQGEERLIYPVLLLYNIE